MMGEHVMNVAKYAIKNIWNFFPLIAFLETARFYSEIGIMKWLYAYEISAMASIFHIIIMYATHQVINRIIIGIDVYMIFGGFFTFFYQEDVLSFLRMLHESGMILSITVVGIFSMIFTRNSFLGSITVNEQSKKYSYYLLIISMFSTIFSYCFSGNILLSGVIPIVLLTVINKMLINKVDMNI